MVKIRSIEYINHSLLGNLYLNFTNKSDKAADTVIFAGENGTGKSTVLDSLYKIVSHEADFEANVEFEGESSTFLLKYRYMTLGTGTRIIMVSDASGMNLPIGSADFGKKYPSKGIYSDVDINFHPRRISSVTSSVLDGKERSRRSSSELSTEINQLLIDIQALDDGDIAHAVRTNPEAKAGELIVNTRMPRFTSSFEKIFEKLEYSHIENTDGEKKIYFKKGNALVPIDSLSSGEKQIIYRGGFLLRDVNATLGAFVFIDEPEISLHPKWQEKILDYYKSIFTDSAGKQTSQIFTVTHSPFIIHNKYRKNDKVIVLERDAQGNIAVKDKPDYYKCNSLEVVEDAFTITGFDSTVPTVYLEGRTDEKYFNRALEVFSLNVPFQFKWIGYLEETREKNTGTTALDKAFDFLVSNSPACPYVCLYDCDANKQYKKIDNVYRWSINQYENGNGIKKGIENALILDDVDIKNYYSCKSTVGDYGERKSIETFNKMSLCDHICQMDNEELYKILDNINKEIERINKYIL